MGENTEELCFIPSAVSSSAGCHEPNSCVTCRAGKKRFKYFEIPPLMVEDDGELHTMKLQQRLLPSEARRKEGASF